MAGQINRYDTPAQANFINTYVPIPFDAMMKIAGMKQQMVERNDQGAAELTAALGSFQVAPFDQKGLEEVSSEYKTKLANLVSNSQPGAYEVTKGILNLRAQMAADPRLKDMVYNFGQYGEYVENKQKSTEKDITKANTYAMDSSIRSITNEGGAVGRFKKGQSGKWSAGTWYENQNVDAGLASFVKDVVASSTASKGFTTDATGNIKLVVSSEEGGKSLNALAAPFGIYFNKNIDKHTGRVTMKAVAEGMGQEAVATMTDFFKTKEGAQLMRDAEYANPEAPQKEAVDMYLRKVTKTLNTYVSTNSKYAVDYDPLYEASERKRIADQNIPIVQRQGMGVPESKLNSSTAVNEERQRIAGMITDVDKKRDSYLEMNGILKGSGVYVGKNGKPVDFTEMRDVDGQKVDLVLKQFDADKAQIERTQQGLERAWKIAVRSTKAPNGGFLKDDWKPEDYMTTEQLTNLKQDAVKRTLNNTAKDIGAAKSQGLDEDAYMKTPEFQKFYQQHYDELLAERSETLKAVNATLKKNAAASVVDVGVTNFPSKETETYLEKQFIPWVMEGGTKNRIGGGTMRVRNFKTGEEVTDPSELKKYSGAVVSGGTYDPTEHTLQIVYRPYSTDSSGKKTFADHNIMIDSPRGIEAQMVKAGWTDVLELSLRDQLVDVENDISDTGILGVGDDQLTVRKLTPSEKVNYPENVNFIIMGKGADGKIGRITTQQYPTTSVADVIKWYTRAFLPAQKQPTTAQTQ